jgi:peptide chain release factor
MLFTAGRGPVECQVAVARIADRFCTEAARQGLTATVLDSHTSDVGLLSCLIAIDGDATIFAGSWQGTIEWKCVSPLRETRRKNWFIGAQMIEPPIKSTWNDKDIRFETYRASGPGGQHVNTTNSAVRVIHVPTGCTAQAQEERSQYHNKALALARLAALMTSRNTDAVQATEQFKWSSHNTVIRGESVKVFIGEAFRLQ